MKFDFSDDSNSLSISEYAPGWVRIQEIVVKTSCVLTPRALHQDLLPNELTAIVPSHFEQLLELKPELVILGTGLHHQFIEDRLVNIFTQKRVGFEAMSTGAACRSFNVLVSDDRAVVAALFMI